MRRVIERHPDANRAVSPVIGVILMVAITVILAAVIGAFVLEIGDQQETAPNTSFDSEQETRFMGDIGYKNAPKHCLSHYNGACANASIVSISHAGGGTLDISQIRAKVEGNRSVYGPKDDPSTDPFEAAPVPDYTQTFGTNEKVEFSSGETWEVGAYNQDTPPAEELEYVGYRFDFINEPSNDNVDEETNVYGERVANPNTQIGQAKFLDQGEQITVVWSASSGGKTQTLFKYGVQ
jgi:flagellin-like protein